MLKSKKQELVIFLIIISVASFFRLYHLDTAKIFLALTEILTVAGLYLLTREMFEWRLAAIASYLMAISIWHIDFLRTEPSATIIPFVLVYAFYFIWKGLRSSRPAYFVIAGIFGGLACLPSNKDLISPLFIFLAPLTVIILFINYWWYLKKDFDHTKYEYAKTKLLQGFVLLALTTFMVASPVIVGLWQHGEFFPPMPISGSNVIKTFSMFNFSDSPLLPWPIGIFFVVGFVNELIHWVRRKHGHFSTTHTLLMVWFFAMLVPGFMSSDLPDILQVTVGAMPVVIILTARGIWWFFDKLNSWYKIHDSHSKHEAHAVTALVMIVFLFSIGFMEYWRYFK